MNIEINKIYTIKLTNGDEILTRITSDEGDSVTIEHPLLVIPSQQGLQMIFALFTADPKTPVTLNKSACIMIVPAREEATDSFTEAVTGIKVTRNSNKILMG
jgi:hypothetical protein